MGNIMQDIYEPLINNSGFECIESHENYPPAGKLWQLPKSAGHGYYWIYAKKDLFDIKIHDFYFHEDSFLEFHFPECMSIAYYESISGEEFDPYRRLVAGEVKSFFGSGKNHRISVHKKIPIRSIGIEIMPAYYNDFLKDTYASELYYLKEAFQFIDQSSKFPEMILLLKQIQNYRSEGISAELFYEAKVVEAISLVIDHWKNDLQYKNTLSDFDRQSIANVTAYIADHYAYSLTLDHLSKIACMSQTKLKNIFRQLQGCTITQYIQQRRMSQAEYLLSQTDIPIIQVANSVGYISASRFAKLFFKSTGLLPGEYRRNILVK